MLEVIAVSDLHLGEPDSVLHLRYPSLMDAFARRFHELAGASGAAEVETLVLMGDIPDYTLASWETCHQNLRRLFDALLLGSFDGQDGTRRTVGVTTRVRHVVYVPGNHDHALWTHALEQIVLPQGVALPDRETHHYGLGRIVLKDSALGSGKLRWATYDGTGFDEDVELESRPFLHRSAGEGAATWDVSPTDGASPVSLASYFASEEALKAVNSFTIQYPHLSLPIGARAFLFQHGQYLSATVVGKAKAYRPRGLEAFAPQEAGGGSAAARELEALLFDGGAQGHRGLELARAPADEGGAELDAILQGLSPDELRLLGEGLEVKAAPADPATRGLEGRSLDALRAIKDKLASLIRCFTKHRGKRALSGKAFLDVEAATARFMDELWEPARNCEEPINDTFWNGVGRFDQLGEVMRKLLGAQPNHEIGDDFRFLLERYLEKLGADLPEEVVFVFGDTHEPGRRTFDGVCGGHRVRVFNTGAWHAKVEDWQHGAKYFTVSENGTCELMDIELTREELAAIKPFAKKIDGRGEESAEPTQ